MHLNENFRCLLKYKNYKLYVYTYSKLAGLAGKKKADKLPISAICPLWLPLGDLNPGPPD